jgi:hypothetical protein
LLDTIIENQNTLIEQNNEILQQSDTEQSEAEMEAYFRRRTSAIESIIDLSSVILKLGTISDNQATIIQQNSDIAEQLNSLNTIIDNQTAVIEKNDEVISQLEESNTVLVNFFFLFIVFLACKFVHFLFYKVFFGVCYIRAAVK